MSKRIVRYRTANGAVEIGVRVSDQVFPIPVDTLGGLLMETKQEIDRIVGQAIWEGEPAESGIQLLPPVDGRMEVWAAGVTYRRSKDARVEESTQASVYELVYDAQRPELFFKAAPWRVVTNFDTLYIRNDSELNVPEPEFAVVVNADGQIVGYTICNDMSSRSIEGANPLYLPQAKVYDNSCSLNDGFVLADDDDEPDRAIVMEILRENELVWYGQSSTSQLKRAIPDLVKSARSNLDFPEGFILSTGTGIVPELEFTVRPGDIVVIRIDGLGKLINPISIRPAREKQQSESLVTS